MLPEPTPLLTAELAFRAGSLALDCAFALTAPWTVLFAPSGAGKTTILRLIAGLEQPASGRIVLYADGSPAVLFDSAMRIDLPAERRGVRMVTQRPALFPHLDVRANLLWSRPRRTRAQPGADFAEVVELCRLQPLLGRTVTALSGGERQRVALARALLAPGSRLLLLDEPFSGLEAGLRQQLTAALRPWLAARGIPALLVTHDVSEALATEAWVLRLAGGRIVQQGLARAVLAPECARLLDLLQPAAETLPLSPAAPAPVRA